MLSSLSMPKWSLFSISTSGVGKLICFVKLSFICSLEKLKLKQECILSRMRTAHSSSRHRGVSTPPQSRHPWSRHPPRAGITPEQAPPGAGTLPRAAPLEQVPQLDPPQLPSWVWAWTRFPSTSPLGVGLEIPQPDPPKLPPWVLAWKPARHAGIPPPPPETCFKAC